MLGRQHKAESARVSASAERVGEGASEYLARIQEINREVFPKGAFDTKEIIAGLADKRSVLAVLRDSKSNDIVGYALAVPTNKPTVAHYASNAILPQYQGNGFVAKLSQIIEDGLRENGFVFVTRDTRGGNTRKGKEYAETVRKAYGKRIVSEQPTVNALGKATSFTIEL